MNVVCADTDEHARWLAGPAALAFLKLRGGKPEALVPPEEAAAYPYNDMERAFVDDRWADQAVGSPETVERQLTDLLARTGANELMLTTMVYDLGDAVPLVRAGRGEGPAEPDKITAGGLPRPLWMVWSPADVTRDVAGACRRRAVDRRRVPPRLSSTRGSRTEVCPAGRWPPRTTLPAGTDSSRPSRPALWTTC